MTAAVTIPYSYVCGNNTINKEDDNDESGSGDSDDDDDDDDLDDRFKGCYPMLSPPGNVVKYYNFNNILCLCIYGCLQVAHLLLLLLLHRALIKSFLQETGMVYFTDM